jgi:hypothetical protein
LAAVCLECEKGFKRVKGFAAIPDVQKETEKQQENDANLKITA